MNWTQIKDCVSDICPAGAVIAFWSPIQEMAGLSSFTVMTNIISITEVSHSGEDI